MDKDDKTFLKIAVAGIAIVLAAAFLLYWLLDSAACRDIAAQTSKETKWSFMSGCYVKVNDKWTPADRWRNNE